MAELFDAPKKQDSGEQASRPGAQLSDEVRNSLALQFNLSQQRRDYERSNPNAIDLVGEGLYSAGYQTFQSPIYSVGQVADDLAKRAGYDTNVAGFVDRMPAPEHEKFGTARWHAQTIGGGFGMILPFMAVKGTLGATGLSFAARTETATLAGSRLLSLSNAGLVADGAIAGFAYDALLRPVEKQDMDRFWEVRRAHGLAGAATFGTLTAGSVTLRHVTRPLAGLLAEAPKPARFAYDVAMGTLPGLPAGVVAADANAYLTTGKLATPEQRKESAYAMLVAGGALSAFHSMPGSNVPLGDIARAYSTRRAQMANVEGMLAERALRAADTAGSGKVSAADFAVSTPREAGSSAGRVVGERSSAVPGERPSDVVGQRPSRVVGERPGRALASNDVEKVAQPTEVNLNVRPEHVQLLQKGVDLAFKASDVEVTPQQVRDFFRFARGEGAPLKAEMLEVAKQYERQDPHMMTLIREAYMPPEGVVSKVVEGDIKLKTPNATPEQYQRWGQFMDVVGKMPQDVDGYINFRHDVFRWLNENRDLHDWALQYAQQNKYSKVAGPLDYYFETSHLARFFDAVESGSTIPVPGRNTQVIVEHQGFAMTDPLANYPLIIDLAASGKPATGRTRLGLEAELPPEFTQPLDVRGIAETPGAPRVTTEVRSDVAPETTVPKRTTDASRLRVSPLAMPQPGTMEYRMQTFEHGSTSLRRIESIKLSDNIGAMTTSQFATWLDYVYGKPPSGDPNHSSMNIHSMMMQQKGALLQPDVLESYLRYRNHEVQPREGAREIPLESIRQILGKPSVPAKGSQPIPDYLSFYIEARLAQTEGHRTPDAKAHQVLEAALPRWFVEQVKAEYTVDAKIFGGKPGYSEHLLPALVELLEGARISNPPKPPKFGEPIKDRTPPPNDLNLRLERLGEISKVEDPIIRDRLFELGKQDQSLVRNITQKLNPEKSAPEYQELLRLVLPEATNLKDVKLLLDAIHFGNKANRADRGSENAKSNVQLAMATAEHIVPQSNPNFQRVQDLVIDFITGKIRDPFTPREGGPGKGGPGNGGPGNGGQRGGQRGRGDGQAPPQAFSAHDAGPQAHIPGPGERRGSSAAAEVAGPTPAEIEAVRQIQAREAEAQRALLSRVNNFASQRLVNQDLRFDYSSSTPPEMTLPIARSAASSAARSPLF